MVKTAGFVVGGLMFVLFAGLLIAITNGAIVLGIVLASIQVLALVLLIAAFIYLKPKP